MKYAKTGTSMIPSSMTPCKSSVEKTSGALVTITFSETTKMMVST